MPEKDTVLGLALQEFAANGPGESEAGSEEEEKAWKIQQGEIDASLRAVAETLGNITRDMGVLVERLRKSLEQAGISASSSTRLDAQTLSLWETVTELRSLALKKTANEAAVLRLRAGKASNRMHFHLHLISSVAGKMQQWLLDMARAKEKTEESLVQRMDPSSIRVGMYHVDKYNGVCERVEEMAELFQRVEKVLLEDLPSQILYRNEEMEIADAFVRLADSEKDQLLAHFLQMGE